MGVLISGIGCTILAIILSVIATCQCLPKIKENESILKKEIISIIALAIVSLTFSMVFSIAIYENSLENVELVNNYQIMLVDDVFSNGIAVVDPTVENDAPQLLFCVSDGIEQGDFVGVDGNLVLSGKAAVMEYCKIKGISYGILTANP